MFCTEKDFNEILCNAIQAFEGKRTVIISFEILSIEKISSQQNALLSFSKS